MWLMTRIILIPSHQITPTQRENMRPPFAHVSWSHCFQLFLIDELPLKKKQGCKVSGTKFSSICNVVKFENKKKLTGEAWVPRNFVVAKRQIIVCSNSYPWGFVYFLVPQPITVGSVVDANTSLTQVKITWTNVASSGGVEVARGATKQVITDPTVNEYIFTGLTAGDPQMCFVTTLGSNLCSAEKAATAKTIGECDTRSK